MLSFKAHLQELSKPKEIGDFKKAVSKFNTVDVRDQSWSMTLPAAMKKYGFSLLGSGKYASVYGNPKYDYVLKVFMKDSAYLKWIEFVQKNKGNPYVPKVKGKVVKITPTFYAIRLEKLSKFTSGGQFMKDFSAWQKDNSFKSSDQNIQDILDYFGKHKKLLDLHGENMMMRGNQLVIIDPFYNWFGKYNPGKYTIDPDDINPEIF
jgi:hypothetical protein